MSTTIKKIIKYVIIVALLGAVVFFGVKLLFPTPSPTLAFETTISLSENEAFQKNNSASENFMVKYATTLSAESTQVALLNHSNKLIAFQKQIITYLSQDLAFAKNSSIYNSKAKELEKLEKEISGLLANATTYIDQQFEPVYNQTTTPSNNALKAILSNLTKNNKAIANKMTNYLETTTTIYLDLEQTFVANPYSKKISQLISVWVAIQNEFLNDAKYTESETYLTTNGLNNLTLLQDFKNANLSHNVAISYNTNKTNLDSLLQSISKAEIKGLLSAYEVSNVENFLNSIENAEIKASTRVLNDFIKGVQ